MLLGNAGTSTARKPHRCWWCGEPIPIGESYQWWVWKDGKPITIRCHGECRTAWDHLSRIDRDASYDVMQGAYHRGCCCEHGNCQCKKGPPNV